MNYSIWFFLGIACLFSGCASGPDYKKPDVHLPENWRPTTSVKLVNTPFEPAQLANAQLKGGWWTMFADEQLNQLAQQALEHNQNLVIASGNLYEARQNVLISSAAFWPQVVLQASDTRTKTSANRPLASYDTTNASTVQTFNTRLPCAVIPPKTSIELPRSCPMVIFFQNKMNAVLVIVLFL